MTRENNINKQLIREYRNSLDQQVSNKAPNYRDIVDGNDFKMLESFVRNEKLDSPIFYQGCIVGDPKYDISLNKFLAKDSSFNRSFNIDNYDDDAFKRRNLEHLKAKELLKQMNGSQTPGKI